MMPDLESEESAANKAVRKEEGGGRRGAEWGCAGIAYQWRQEERRLLYGINGHSVRLVREKGGV